MALEIGATLADGTLSIWGSGWPANGVATIQATDLTGFSEFAQVAADSSGSWSFSCGDPCKAPGEFKVAATNGSPQPGAEYNYEWSNIVELWCQGAAGGGEQPDPEPASDEPDPEPASDEYESESYEQESSDY